MAKLIIVENQVLITAEIVEIVRLLSHDKTVKEVAEILKKNRRTMEANLMLIKKECGVSTLQGMVALFFRNKLIK